MVRKRRSKNLNIQITENAVYNKTKDPSQLRKPPYIEASLYRQIKKHVESNNKRPLRTKSRKSTITTSLIGLNVEIHNGKEYVSRLITEDMVGRKLGEFSNTRKFKSHAKGKK